MSEHYEGWSNCEDCGRRYKWTLGQESFRHRDKTLCAACVKFVLDIGPINWRLFQRQRMVVEELVHDPKLTEEEQEVLGGIQALLDHIIDTAAERGKKIPEWESVLLDRLAGIKPEV